MCALLQIPCLVRMSRAALEEGKCVVIGLQSTGEARTADVVAERGEILDDYVSGPRVLLTASQTPSPLPGFLLSAHRRSATCHCMSKLPSPCFTKAGC